MYSTIQHPVLVARPSSFSRVLVLAFLCTQGEGSTAHMAVSRLGIGRVGKVRLTRCPQLFGIGQLGETPGCDVAASSAVFPCILDRKQLPSLPSMFSHRSTVGTPLRLWRGRSCASSLHPTVHCSQHVEASHVVLQIARGRARAVGRVAHGHARGRTSERSGCARDRPVLRVCVRVHAPRGVWFGRSTRRSGAGPCDCALRSVGRER